MLKKPNVLQINKLYYPHIGGVEKVVQDLAEGISPHMHTQVLVCQEKGGKIKEIVNQVSVTRTRSLGIYFSMPLSFDFISELNELGKHSDILHFHMPFPLGDAAYLFNYWLGRLKKQKVVITWHSDIVRQKKLMKLYKPIMNRFLKRADVITVTSPNMIEHSKFLGPYRDKCRIVPLGIDLKSLEQFDEGVISKYYLKYSQTVLFVGRLCYYKGIEYLIEAFRGINANLIVVGDGELKEELKNKCKDQNLKDKVHFTGKASQAELNSWYRKCDLFVLPSVENSEAFGLVQVEAMVFGKPVINTNLKSGVPYVSLNGETGITVEPRNIEQLRTAIQSILNDHQMAERYGTNAKNRALQFFTKEKMVNTIIDIYQDILRG